MNLTALKRLLIILLLLNGTVFTALYCQNVKPIATFPGGIIFLPTVNVNNVVIRYTTPFVREATFYPRGDTLLAQRLDSCKREYIALSWSYDALEQRYIDSTYSAKVKHEQMIADNAKQVRRVRRKSWFRGFLWGGVGGCLAMAWAARL